MKVWVWVNSGECVNALSQYAGWKELCKNNPPKARCESTSGAYIGPTGAAYKNFYMCLYMIDLINFDSVQISFN